MPEDKNEEHQTEGINARKNDTTTEETLPTEMRVSHIVYFDSKKENTFQDTEVSKFGQGGGPGRSHHSKLLNRRRPMSDMEKQTSSMKMFWIGAILATIIFVGGLTIGLSVGDKTSDTDTDISYTQETTTATTENITATETTTTTTANTNVLNVPQKSRI